ncbi:hypothetical protein niasHS_006052 [Heterodera schachtii]|uniref:Protein kinase domain-containing protein n=1 Tax=Heterodera schachtii TaxID=97005 RepID=A0ABD2JVT7_HETSC
MSGKASRMTRNVKTLIPEAEKADEKTRKAAKELESFLVSLSPFNKKWEVERTLSSGAYGVVFLCNDPLEDIKGVVKVARAESGSETAEWEAAVMDKVTKNAHGKSINIVKLLDKGVLVAPDNSRLNFMVLEFCELQVKKYIGSRPAGPPRRARVCQVLLGALKAIYDMHNQGLLHRDLKPENMGILSRADPVTVLYDLGMSRMFTNQLGQVRDPRTVVPFKGTVEWASGHAVKGREQTRWDDLIAWLYIAVELFDPDINTESPYPWDNHRINNTKAVRYLKSSYSPAKILLKNCPRQFYSIHTYLYCGNRLLVPDYAFLADKVGQAMEEIQEQIKNAPTPSKQPQQSAASVAISKSSVGQSMVSKR